jgi:drug/metabolite transporter (DMT)-like permease
MEVLFVSSLLAFLFLFVYNLSLGNIKLLLSYPPKKIAIQAGLGFIGLFLYSALYYYGLTGMSAQDACIINYLWPIMIILFSAPILKERITLRKMTAVLMSFFGLVVIATRGLTAVAGSDSLRGVAAVFAAAVCYGLFSVLNKKADYNQSVAMMIYFGVTAAASSAGFFWRASHAAPSPVQVAGFIWLGVFVNAIAYFLWALALRGSDTARISNLAYLTPFLSVIVSAVFLREQIYLYSIAGLLFIIFGIVWMSIKPRLNK